MKFTKGKNNIVWLGSDFQAWFGDMEFPEIDQMLPLTSKELTRPMNDTEIMAELKPGEVLLSEVYQTLKTMDKDTWALFYVRDVSGVLRTVSVRWDDGGWNVDAHLVSGPDAWRDGDQVFSRNWNLDTLNLALISSDALTLASALKLVKEAGYKVYKEV